MATRPFFYFNGEEIQEGSAEFQWFSGFSVSQKQKSIQSFHEAIRRKGFHPLEISTKSTEETGRKLSAFNLKLDGYLLECVFQASKVYELGGPYTDLLACTPKEAKTDERKNTSGKLIGFLYKDIHWELEPKTLFYDWLYYNAVKECLLSEEIKELLEYDAFTDIEFNPKKAMNTQARSIVLVRYVFRKYHTLPDMDKEAFTMLHRQILKKK